jgi:signal recognition particle subunit SEC65
MKKYVRMDFCWMFDPNETWQHSFQVEKEIADFLRAKGLEAELVKTVDGSTGYPMYLIKRVDPLLQAVKETETPKNEAMKTIIDKIRYKEPSKQEKQFKQGRFVPRKGYLKKE